MVGYHPWHNRLSNTVCFKRPAKWVVKKYTLAGNKTPFYDGLLSHIVLMQNVTKAIIDRFISDLKHSLEGKEDLNFKL